MDKSDLPEPDPNEIMVIACEHRPNSGYMYSHKVVVRRGKSIGKEKWGITDFTEEYFEDISDQERVLDRVEEKWKDKELNIAPHKKYSELAEFRKIKKEEIEELV